MMSDVSVYEWITIGGALVGVYVMLTVEIGKLKSRVEQLEKSESETKQILNDLLAGVNDIKLLLASNQIR